ncbi:flavin-containing monooxygenase [Kibdelosporangium aridum]|uniref:flavin-containing monooxygenase n=1 Tax=Kibdelosporangium aridum TaxID=2030 RepID=UPI0035EF0C72
MTSTINQSVSTGKGGRPTPHVQVAIIGTGFSGLGVAIRLLENKIKDFVLLERAGEVGGTWRDNTYPGCACDVASILYSYSFAQKSDWNSTYGSRQELFDYLKDVADRYGVRPYVKFHHEVLDATWDENLRRWYIKTSQGDYTAQVLVAGTGYLSDAVIPDIPGIEDFQGKIMHSSQWDHDYDLDGRNVAVIGTGASAIQFVPAIQPKVAHLDLYQRSAPWVGPKADNPIKGVHAWALKRVPGYRAFRRGWNKNGREILAFLFKRPPLAEKTIQGMAARHLAKSVPDPELRAKLTPNFAVACKRLLFSNKWYPAIQQDNVEIINGAIDKVTENGVIGSDGRERTVDAIILGTGFLATKRPIADKLSGRGGVKLADAWEARRDEGLPGHHCGRVPQPLPDARTEHLTRPLLADGDDRGADRLRRRRGQDAEQAWAVQRRGQPGGGGGVQQGNRVMAGRFGVGRQDLHQLVHRLDRP